MSVRNQLQANNKFINLFWDRYLTLFHFKTKLCKCKTENKRKKLFNIILNSDLTSLAQFRKTFSVPTAQKFNYKLRKLQTNNCKTWPFNLLHLSFSAFRTTKSTTEKLVISKVLFKQKSKKLLWTLCSVNIINKNGKIQIYVSLPFPLEYDFVVCCITA